MNILSKEMLLAKSGPTVFVRPNLSSDGIIGGTTFAVRGSSSNGMNRGYKAVDGKTNTYWEPKTSPYSFEFYNPQKLNVTKIVITMGTGSNIPTVTGVYAGNNNNPSQAIAYTSSRSGLYLTISLTNSEYYTTYLMAFTNLRNFAEVDITAMVE